MTLESDFIDQCIKQKDQNEFFKKHGYLELCEIRPQDGKIYTIQFRERSFLPMQVINDG